MVLIAAADSVIDYFHEAECKQNNLVVPAASVTGFVSCKAVTGIRFSWTNWTLYSWEASYEGDMAYGRMNGRGEYFTTHGSRYEGYFLEDQREGQGTFFNKDSSSVWSGNWERDELTGPANVLKTTRRDIFNKLGSGPFPSIAEAVYTGFTVNGLLNGAGKLEFFSEDPDRSLIFAIEAQFEEGSIDQPTGEILITWGPHSGPSLQSSQAVLKQWKSTWSYGNQRVSGFIVFMEQDLAYHFTDGLLQPVNASDFKQPIYHEPNFIDPKLSELQAIRFVIEAVRAFEWHFIFNRLQLAPLTSLIDQDAANRNFEGHIDHAQVEMQEL
jgi:hypothetical protein